ncbi:beta-1,4-N-acetylgalactosaminyltransferase 3 [Polypterus senegalus]|uniref:beta-1,4-N-acetylgalactosaminyltransferase 3 n=1 Tax=Polypterus senegalus TaxID=55291 RepID=UPI0019635C70|nr:beta-1,4-N-acetylgalactosaminyltransferase 3 [Polypterus senegalus]
MYFFPLKMMRKNVKYIVASGILALGILAYLDFISLDIWHQKHDIGRYPPGGVFVGESIRREDGNPKIPQQRRAVPVENGFEFKKDVPPWKPEFIGQANLHIFEDWCGSSIDQLCRNLHFPLYPHTRTTIKKLAVAPSWTNYGLRIFGYIHPFATGIFQFAVASDDNSEFWLSKDTDPEHLQLLASVGKSGKEWTAPGEFGKFHSQVSQPVHLSSDNRYYFEVLHKQDHKGTDHVEVGWRLNRPGLLFTLIEPQYISLFANESLLKMNDIDHIPLSKASYRINCTNPLGTSHSSEMLRTDPRDEFFTFPLIEEQYLHQILPDCIYNPSYVIKDFPLNRYQGLHFVHLSLIYPNDFTRLTHMESENRCFYHEAPYILNRFGFYRYMKMDTPVEHEVVSVQEGESFELVDNVKHHNSKEYIFQYKDPNIGHRELPEEERQMEHSPKDYGDDYDDYNFKRRRKMLSAKTTPRSPMQTRSVAKRRKRRKESQIYLQQVNRFEKQNQEMKIDKREAPFINQANTIQPANLSQSFLQVMIRTLVPRVKHIRKKEIKEEVQNFHKVLAAIPLYQKSLNAKTKEEKENNTVLEKRVFLVQENVKDTKLSNHSQQEIFDTQNRMNIKSQEYAMWQKEDMEMGRKLEDQDLWREKSFSISPYGSNTEGYSDDLEEDRLFFNPAIHDQEVNWEQTFSVDNLDFHSLRSDDIDLTCNVSGNLLLKESEALEVVETFMKKFKEKNKEKFELRKVVNVEKRVDEIQGSRYLLELELLEDGKRTVRLSQYIYALNHNIYHMDVKYKRKSKHNKKMLLCNPVGFSWKRDTMVHFIVPVKNQARWVQKFIADMEELYEITQDGNFNVIITDYSSTDMDVEKALKQASLPRFQYLKLKGNFERAAGLQAGIDLIQDNHSIIFLCDLHIYFPPMIIDSIRKHCIEGRMAFAPIVMRLNCGASPDQPDGYWEVNGFGLLGIFKSDLANAGGMNTLEYHESWGGEDWELLDRILQAGLEVERIHLRHFYHHYHSKRGMWNRRIYRAMHRSNV